jgi:hypothetical protein
MPVCLAPVVAPTHEYRVPRECACAYIIVIVLCSLDSLYLSMFPSFFSVIIACDQSNARSILLYQTNIDKIKELTSHTMMGVSGPNCDLVNFTE